MSLGFEELTFTASEAGGITGMSPARQRDMRRRGFLSAHDGQARFDLYALAEIMVFERMSSAGIGPKVASKLAEVAATGIGWHVLQNPDAYTGDHLSLIGAGIVQPVEWSSEDDEAHALLKQRAAEQGLSFSPEAIDAIHNPEAMAANRQAEFLARWIAGELRGRVIPGRFLIIWADGSEVFHEDVQAAFDDIRTDDARVTGPVTVLPLESLALDLLKRAGRPFFNVRVGRPLKKSTDR